MDGNVRGMVGFCKNGFYRPHTDVASMHSFSRAKTSWGLVRPVSSAVTRVGLNFEAPCDGDFSRGGMMDKREILAHFFFFLCVHV